MNKKIAMALAGTMVMALGAGTAAMYLTMEIMMLLHSLTRLKP